MNESPDREKSEDKAAESEQLEALQVWASWLQQSAELGADIVQLLRLELQLAITDSKRLLLLALLIVPVLMLVWVGLTVLIAWLVYLINTSVIQGLLAFFAIQLAALIIIVIGCRHYMKSLQLPLTMQQLRNLGGEHCSDS